MSLDKWIKSDKKKKDTQKESKVQKEEEGSTKTKSQSKVRIKDTDSLLSSKESEKKHKKYLLVCSKKSCGYQKRIVKKQLTDRDKTCPRCNGAMKFKEI